ncbi:tRNA preQ1(34) S-adenosylmethionine ribosyltransferase-isomerase QueA [Candidatus Peregrinibacteria bacterium]|nr:tRNA preQ1(34) S-adenosylmethionine ribosyltransferase-isomerase QueA [Candidatus Peregrinibacteria bacterium]
MRTSDFDFQLPRESIAQNPVCPRDMSKLLVYDVVKDKIFHRRFRDIVDFVKSGDAMVVNRSRVIMARVLFDNKEIFLLKNLGGDVWSCLVSPGKFFLSGKNFPITDSALAEVLEVLPDATRIIRFSDDPQKLGQIPLPPYIKNSNAEIDQYQTVFAVEGGSVAAPTAGLHFTPELIRSLKSFGVLWEEILLHVGRGTFLPVKSDFVDEHKMHSEYFDFSLENARNLNLVKQNGGKIFAVGTTSVRVLENCFADGKFRRGNGETDIFIYPGKYDFNAVDALVTNFHLPKSTLIMLVAAFLQSKGVSDGRKKILGIYETARINDYRFYSFGDAMLII